MQGTGSARGARRIGKPAKRPDTIKRAPQGHNKGETMNALNEVEVREGVDRETVEALLDHREVDIGAVHQVEIAQ